MTIYIGFGKDCRIAEIMNRGNLRKESMPFDWLFGFPSYIKHSLDTNFSEWFNPEYLTPMTRSNVADSTPLTRHDLYTEHTDILTQIHNQPHEFFNHFDMSDPYTIESFERRITRYKDAINSQDNVLLITNNSFEEMESNGLNDYYKNRDAKTSVLYLNEIFNGSDYATISSVGKVNEITYGYAMAEGLDAINDDSNKDHCIEICNLIIKISEEIFE